MEYKVLPFVKEDIKEDGIVKGYGSTFGGKPDSYGDIIVEGAFKDSIESNFRGGLGLPMLWQHNSDEPAGDWKSAFENTKGLFVEGPMEKESDIGRHRYNLLKMGAVKGLSIGFDLPRDKEGRLEDGAVEWDDKKRIRYLKKINLWEVSLVTFAANTRAKITSVKSGLLEAKTERELEKALRDSGLSRSEAVYLASLCKSGLRDSGAEDEVQSILDTLNRTVEEMKTDPVSDILNTIKSVNEFLKI